MSRMGSSYSMCAPAALRRSRSARSCQFGGGGRGEAEEAHGLSPKPVVRVRSGACGSPRCAPSRMHSFTGSSPGSMLAVQQQGNRAVRAFDRGGFSSRPLYSTSASINRTRGRPACAACPRAAHRDTTLPSRKSGIDNQRDAGPELSPMRGADLVGLEPHHHRHPSVTPQARAGLRRDGGPAGSRPSNASRALGVGAGDVPPTPSPRQAPPDTRGEDDGVCGLDVHPVATVPVATEVERVTGG